MGPAHVPTPFFWEEVMTKGNGVNFELDELLHPAQAFIHPRRWWTTQT